MANLQNVAADNGAGATSLVITVAATTVGSTIIVGAHMDGTATVSSVTDNKSGGSQTYASRVALANTGGQGGALYTLENTAAGITQVTINFTGSVAANGFVSEESHLVVTGNYDGSNSALATSGTAFNSGNAAATQASDVAYGLATSGGTAGLNTSAPWVPVTGTGFTSGLHTNGPDGCQMLVARQVLGAAGNYAFSGTNPIGPDQGALVLLLKSAAGAALAGTPSDVTSAAAALSTGIQLAAAAASASVAIGTLTNWKTQTLSGTLDFGTDGICGPGAIWTNGTPTDGSVVYYDGASLTVEPDGSLVATTNAFTALLQWNNAGTWSQLLVQFTPGFGAFATSSSVATGILMTAIQMRGAAASLSNAVAAITTLQNIAGAASSLSSATGALNTAIHAAAAAIDNTTASGALSTLIHLLGAGVSNSSGAGSLTINPGGAPLVGSPSDISSATAALSTLIKVAAAAADVSSATAALTAQIRFSGSGIDSSIAVGGLNTSTIFAGSAVSASAAAGALTTVISLAAAASDASSASAAIVTQILMLASAADTASGAGFLTTLDPTFAGSAASVSAAAGFLSTAAQFMSQAVSQSQAAGALATGINMVAAASSNGATYGNLTAVGAGVFSDAVIVYAPPKNATGAMQLIFGVFNQRVGELIAYGVNWDAWLAASWTADQPVTVGATVRPTRHIGLQARCSAQGQTGEAEPEWPAYVGGQVLDGSAVWTMQPLDGSSLVASITSATWSADPAIAVTMQAIRGEITLAGVDTTSATDDTDYDVVCAAQLSDSELKTGKLRIRVR